MIKRTSQLTIVFCLSVLLTYAQGELWGVAGSGGVDNAGVIYKLNADGTNFSIQKSFLREIGSKPTYSQLAEGPDGKLYGTTREGGTQNLGVIFDYDPATGIYTKRFEFYDGAITGGWPEGSLLLADNGKFYGMTTAGGGAGNGDGALFEFDPVSSSYTKLHAFIEATGAHPSGSLIQVGSKLYGMTREGGGSSRGVIFEYDLSTSFYAHRADFNDNTDGPGCNPYGSLTMRDGKLYGLTSNCGATGDDGALFEFDPDSGVITPKFQFGGAEGGGPMGSLFLASNNKFYGVTRNGGANTYGVLFQFDPDQGVNGTYTKKIDLDYATGIHPEGCVLAEGENSMLYGLTSSGGDEGTGVLFQYDILNNSYEAKHSFTEFTGHIPLGSLMRASNGKFYGMTSSSEQGTGALFEYDPAIGTNGTYTVKIRLYDAVNGQQPGGKLLEVNGKFYGTTTGGGAFASGVLYEYNPVTHDYVVKQHFNEWVAALIKASNGLLYGVTGTGGDFGQGTLFEYNPETNALDKKKDFEQSTTGIGPINVMQAGNGKLYGFTNEATQYGLFEYDISEDILTRRLDFNAMDVGMNPRGELVEATNGKLYALMWRGGLHDDGTLLEFDPLTGDAEVKFDFEETNGSRPRGGLVLAANGKYYGTTYQGGIADSGTLFEYDLEANEVTKVAEFTSANSYENGGNPTMTLTASGNGLLYGIASFGGNDFGGTLFEYNPTTQTLTKKHDFSNSATNGSSPSSPLLFIILDQTITFNALDPVTYGDDDFELEATASSGLPVTYTSSDEDIVTISGSNVTIHGAGTVTITAHQAGDVAYHPAVDVEQELVINKVPITVAADVIRKMKNTTDPALTYTITDGALVGDDLLSGSLEREAGEDFGDYNISIGTLSSDNYEITFTGNTFTIHPRFVNKTDDIASDVAKINTALQEWGDYDNDGDLDLLISGMPSGEVPAYHTPPYYLALWRNGATGTSGALIEVTESVGLNVGIQQGSTHFGDYDNDGDLDILTTGHGDGGRTTTIWRNDIAVEGVFTNVTETVVEGISKLSYSTGKWGDYDGDGDLDFVIMGSAITGNQAQLWRNGTTGTSGNFELQPTIFAPSIYATIDWIDYDNDGDLDLSTIGSQKFHLYRNGTTGARGEFTDETATIAPGLMELNDGGAGASWRDIDSDGDLDLLITGYGNSGYTSFWINGTNGTTGEFTDKTNEVASGIESVGSIVPGWGDYDSDGDLDLFFAGNTQSGAMVLQLWNNNHGVFTRVADEESPGFPAINYSVISPADYDNDGDCDLLLVGSYDDPTQYWENTGPIENNPPMILEDLTSSTVAGGNAKLSWPIYGDDFTTESALTYNVRIGTTSGGIDVVSPNALADGTRTIVGAGNASTRPEFNITALAPGTYYWSVQVLDNSYASNGFSSENSFVIKTDQLLEGEDTIRATYGDESFALEFVSNSTNEISYMSSESSVATVVNGEVIIHSVGTTIITASQEEDNNYYEGSTTQVLVVEPTILTIIASESSKVYGDEVPSLSYTATGFVNGDDETILSGMLSVEAYYSSSVGEYTIEQGDLTAGNNYTISYTSAILEVNPATLSIYADYEDIQYGDEIPSVFSFYASGLAGNDTQAVIQGALSTTATATSGVGTYPIEQGSLHAGDNYIIDYTPDDFVIHKAPLYVTADSKSIVYGDEIPVLTFTVSGLVHDDTEDVVTGALEVDAASMSPAGEYYIERGTIASQNYNVYFNPNIITITKATLTVTADDKSKVYGENNPSLTISYSGFVGNDDPSDILAPTVSVGADEFSNAGEYEIELTDGYATSYEFSFVSGTLLIEKKDLVITADNKTRVYGEENPEFTLSYEGFVNGQNEDAISLPNSFVIVDATSNAGEYIIELSGGSADNYELELVNGTLLIEKKDLSIIAENKTRKYGEQNPELTLAVDGFVNGDDVADITLPDLSTNATVDSDAGEYAIQLTGGNAINYELELTNGTLTVGKADQEITITSDIEFKTMGDADFVIEATTSSGLALMMQNSNGHTTLVGNTVSIVSAGSETITVSHPGNPNYNAAESKTITFCINPAKPAITTDFTHADAPVLTSSATAGNQWYRNSNEIANATQQTYTVSEQGSYIVIATIEGCSSVASNEKVILVTGVESESASVISIYPNPVQHDLQLTFSERGTKQIAVISANGVTMHSVETDEQSLIVPMADCTSGMYLVLVQTAAGTSYKRFVKK